MSVNELPSPQTVDRARETRAAIARALARYTSLLVHVETESTASDARVTLAVDLARRFGAALIGVAAEAPQPPPGDAYGGLAFIGDVFEEEERQIRLDLEAARNRFEALTHATELELEWRSSIDNPAQTLSREARSADLILVGRDLSRLRVAGVYRSADPGDLLMEAGRPLLVGTSRC